MNPNRNRQKADGRGMRVASGALFFRRGQEDFTPGFQGNRCHRP